MKSTVGILSLGCPRNLVDSESILGRLSLKGHKVVDIARADVAIVNTCAFIEDAKRESIEAILELGELKAKGKIKKIIVYGCLPQRYRDILKKEIPEVDAFVGKVSLEGPRPRFPITPKHFVYLKICEGCVNNCSFCVIPKIKGKFTSLDIDSVLEKVGQFNREGVSEINIIGQDISGYGLDLYGKTKLAQLVKKISIHAKNVGWLRLLYLNPSRINDDLLKLVRDEPKICKYIDLPIQHINNRVLKLMNRKATKKDIINTISKIRKIIPGVGLRTSVIVGFPSETDKEFKELLNFIEEIKFERLGAFIYSKEEGTRAYDLKGQISQKRKNERFDLVMAAQNLVSEEVNKRFLGQTIDVLIDVKEGSGYLGRSQYDAPEVDGVVYVSSKRVLGQGEFVKVKISATMEYDLQGEVVA
ncbi:MAG: MiaB/RimO family radical SAM methylthiotransferase [Candidatus Omnitrophota bacterium]